MDIEAIIRKYALQNAVQYDGKASLGAVLGKVMAENPKLRSSAREVKAVAGAVIEEVNSLSADAQTRMLEEVAPELLVRSAKPRDHVLPDLEGVEGQVRMRMAPNPSGPLHIGHSRMAVLNDEYVKRYGGKCMNRFEDTDPARVDPVGYDTIPADLDWLGVKIHETVFQSDRFDTYYDVAKMLLEAGKAYVCTCRPDDWRELKNKKKPCEHRQQSVEDQMVRWDKMFDGSYQAEEASVVVKTDLEHPNPAIRDFVGLRIDDTPHPRTGTKYRVYPLMNLSVATDDHLMELSHVLRGKDHLNNTYRQEFVFDYLGWKKPYYIHYGRVSIENAQLSTSKMAEGIRGGTYSGWDDLQLGTLAALRRRGLRPEAIRRYWVEGGAKDVDIEFSWKTLYTFNRELVDDSANRYFFVSEPRKMTFEGPSEVVAKAPVHPDHPERGVRTLKVQNGQAVFVSQGDMESSPLKLRLKDLCNVEVSGSTLRYLGNDLSVLKDGVPVVHWVPDGSSEAEVVMTDGTVRTGLAESSLADAAGKVVQLERFAFVRVEAVTPRIRCVFCHR